MLRGMKYRIYPNDEQAELLNKTFGCCRKVWNLMLNDKIESYKTTKSFGKQTPAMYKKDYSYLKEVDSLALANVQLHLQSAFRNCFDKSRKKQLKFPKPKSRKRSKRSYTTNNQNGTIEIIDNTIKLPKLGFIKAKIHYLPADCIIKSATVSKDCCDKYFVSVLFESDVTINKVEPIKAIGLDYASDGLFVDDKGNKGTNHKYFKEGQKKLAKAQRKLARKKGFKKNETKSHNFYKQKLKVNKIYQHISNQRLDNLHKLSFQITNDYDVVCVECLNMTAMSNKGFGNGKATLDNGYGMFLNFLEYKLKERGKYFVKVDKFYPSSQICHRCGQLHPEMKDLSKRVLYCDCGLIFDRDQNAALNIKNEGLRLLGL